MSDELISADLPNPYHSEQGIHAHLFKLFLIVYFAIQFHVICQFGRDISQGKGLITLGGSFARPLA